MQEQALDDAEVMANRCFKTLNPSSRFNIFFRRAMLEIIIAYYHGGFFLDPSWQKGDF
jgi:hypothetical protein